VLSTLGKGAFGVTKLAHDRRNNRKCAIKIIDLKPKGSKEMFVKECNTLMEAQNKCVVKYLDAFIHFPSGRPQGCLVMEYCDLGPFPKQRLSERKAKFYLYQVAKGVNYLHAHDIIHRDLKPDNILLSSNNGRECVKIADFGISKVVPGTRWTETVIGTKTYMAPEMWQHKPHSTGVDWWSVGVIMHASLGGRHPFDGTGCTDIDDLIVAVCSARYNFHGSAWDDVSSVAKGLIRKLLVVDPSRRLGSAGVFQHPWFTEDSTGALNKARQAMA